MRLTLHLGLAAALGLPGACAPTPSPEPYVVTEQRCVAPDGRMTPPLGLHEGRTPTCAPGERLTVIPACAEGQAPSARWHEPSDPARYAAARDLSFLGDGDATGPYCLPAPPR
ncbi:hypothetical protein Q0812_13655 [Brevundimonas sp. 2R-24]|uniref:Secreted protein n=1 Tax=Peiella sedimenti TaxID=3061083 RepID=A0ABT8SPG0_9CAUL|nr:hypothetical protein [Caulobacteraceae bacterium XZ-24]